MIARLTGFCLLLTTALAAPSLSGYTITWADDFEGPFGSFPSGGWNRIVRSPSDNSNGEKQYYTENASNGQLGGDGTLQIIPSKRGGAGTEYWTSSRFESTRSWNCPAGKAMIFQAEIRVPNFTGSPAKFRGLWPAFWALGNSLRNGGSWPDCGEWDILEVTNNLGDRNQGALHWLQSNGVKGIRTGQTSYTGDQFHTWALKVDRRNSDWKQQKLSWYRDGTEFWSVTGANINNAQEWEKLAYKSYYIILNVAVGGGYPGDPTADTVSGLEAAMRVRYVAVYHST